MQSDEIQKRLAENLKRLRKEKKLTQFELSEKADISEAMIKNIELCHSWPSERTLAQISEALNKDIYSFFMPVSESFTIHAQIKEELKQTITKKYRDYVSSILAELVPPLSSVPS